MADGIGMMGVTMPIPGRDHKIEIRAAAIARVAARTGG